MDLGKVIGRATLRIAENMITDDLDSISASSQSPVGLHVSYEMKDVFDHSGMTRRLDALKRISDLLAEDRGNTTLGPDNRDDDVAKFLDKYIDCAERSLTNILVELTYPGRKKAETKRYDSKGDPIPSTCGTKNPLLNQSALLPKSSVTLIRPIPPRPGSKAGGGGEKNDNGREKSGNSAP